jgi:hypothetical protein
MAQVHGASRRGRFCQTGGMALACILAAISPKTRPSLTMAVVSADFHWPTTPGRREAVDSVLGEAETAGAKILKPAETAF